MQKVINYLTQARHRANRPRHQCVQFRQIGGHIDLRWEPGPTLLSLEVSGQLLGICWSYCNPVRGLTPEQLREVFFRKRISGV